MPELMQNEGINTYRKFAKELTELDNHNQLDLSQQSEMLKQGL